MHLTVRLTGLIAIFLIAVARVSAQQPPGQPFVWKIATPESQGMSQEKLDALKERLIDHKTTNFLVARNDKVVYEWYAEGQGPTKPHGTASLAKAIVGGLSLAVALTDGKIGLDDPAGKFITQWRDDPRKSKIRIRHLGSHTSGIEDAEADKLPHDKLTGWKGDFWKRLDIPNDPFTISRDTAPALFEPGEKLAYSNPGIGLLTYAVTAAIKDGPQRDICALLRERVMRPIGVPDDEWSCGYGKTFNVDGLPLVGSWGGGNYSARACASIGRLMLREGDWDGRGVVSREAVRAITGSAGQPGACGMGWWTNAAGRYAGLPRDAYWGAGAGDQLLLIVPSLNLIMVRNGQTIAPLPGEPPVREDDVFTRYHDYRARVLFEPLMAAVTQNVAAPPVLDRHKATKSSGQLNLTPGDQQIVVLSTAGRGWKAVVDRQHGGVITELRIGADGENIISNDGNRFEGLFNTIYVDFQETGKDGAYVAKGSLYFFGAVSKMSVVEQRAEEVVVEVEGIGGNQVSPKADVLRYRQRYTFLPDRIVCSGEVEWLFDKVVPGSHPELLQMQGMFRPDAVQGELRAWNATSGLVELPQTNSKGKNLPAGLDYPFAVEVPLKDGSALQFRSLQMPPDVTQARFYWNEYPRQIDGKRGFAFKAWEGWPGNGNVQFSGDKPIRYEYEVVFSPQIPPTSSLASNVVWAAKESIVRQAKGGDNWPITWADDGHLYSAYGDANGFDPKVPQKLSMGLVRVEGDASNFRGFNLRSESFEQRGEGPRGRKASGLLMVEGVLYALIRNAENSQLAWSRDHGQTWNWSDWRFTSGFGCPTFLNFGPNYAGARDEYVYVYSHDNDSAYLAADGVALARVPNGKIADLSAYEYCRAVDAAGKPTWTRDVKERGHVFSLAGNCYRTTISYNAGLKRYLMCQIVADPRDTRFAGGFGIYEAPEPWGPWSTMFYTTDWDVGPGETCGLPTKWMSADGLTMHLVFSGDDCFSVRKLTLQRAGAPAE